MYQPKAFELNRVPKYLVKTARSLLEKGFQAYLVGGAVRDLFLGRSPKDFDLATDALPEQTIGIFPRSVATGAKFGNVIVIAEDENGERFDVDVTTFREEEDYTGGRWPSKVEFTKEIKADLSRRDFTFNAMAINMSYFLKNEDEYLDLNEVADPFEGLKDLENNIVRAVRNPYERFQEDGLRAFKACRIASELKFVIEPETKKAIVDSLDIAKQISMERVRDELLKMIKHSPTPSLGFRLMEETGLLDLIIPELLENKGLEQPEWHDLDVYEHSLKCMDVAEDSIKLIALLHDIGKARTRSEDEKGVHFYGHDGVGAEMAREILTRLRFGNSTIERAVNLIRWHMFYYPSAEWRKENDLQNIHEDVDNPLRHGWADSAIRRFIQRVGGQDEVDDLMKLRMADASANEKSEFDPEEIVALEKRIAEVRAKDMVLKITDLDISGHDLMEMGIPHGNQIGKILSFLLEKVLDDPSLNSKEDLKKIVIQEFFKG